jgi:hypothetical protein
MFRSRFYVVPHEPSQCHRRRLSCKQSRRLWRAGKPLDELAGTVRQVVAREFKQTRDTIC